MVTPLTLTIRPSGAIFRLTGGSVGIVVVDVVRPLPMSTVEVSETFVTVTLTLATPLESTESTVTVSFAFMSDLTGDVTAPATMEKSEVVCNV